jgi:hypothetical protein
VRSNFADLTGQQFGRWMATTFFKRNKRIFWRCICVCGNESDVRNDLLLGGLSKSCGCGKRRMPPNGSRYHGKFGTPENVVWRGMLGRCTIPSHSSYSKYGGRGIKVCDRWLFSFEAFLEDMGPKPSRHHSLDRYPDQSGDYAPENCRWATKEQQANNTRSNRRITFNGETKTVSQWARELGVKTRTLHARIFRHGIPLERALVKGLVHARTCHFLEAHGRCQTITEWSRELGINPQTLCERIKRGWPPEMVLSPVPRKR